MLTGCVVVIREVSAVGRAWREYAPEGAAIETFTEPGQVYVPGQATHLKRLGEVLGVDLVVVERAKENGQVIVAIYTMLMMSGPCSLSHLTVAHSEEMAYRSEGSW